MTAEECKEHKKGSKFATAEMAALVRNNGTLHLCQEDGCDVDFGVLAEPNFVAKKISEILTGMKEAV